jgi:oxygen-independent coproporphyrinogen-3 oxidase
MADDELKSGGSATEDATKVGNVFISNYPAYSFWGSEEIPVVLSSLEGPPVDDRPLGLYLHIPFCRKRCDFCYFKVYTDKNSKEIRRYLSAVVKEFETYMRLPYFANRRPEFVYFGGGTPSYISADQMRWLFDELRRIVVWDDVEEVTFECEPGTLSLDKIQALKDVGITRLSLGVENFDPQILELNNRAHRAKEIHRTYGFMRDVGFDQVNIDLIAGMVGETDDNWAQCIEKTIEMLPESVTIYQLEVPYNTTMYQRMKEGGVEVAPVADWDTKRRWTSEAFDALVGVGYKLGSAYTASREGTKFVYRDALWHGADLLGLGVSSFSHIAGNHAQNEHAFEGYISRVEAGEVPITRALTLNDEERMIRQFILQMKLGDVETGYFQEAFGVNVLERFAEPLRAHVEAGLLTIEGTRILATRKGLLKIDNLLPPFFLEQHQSDRYA